MKNSNQRLNETIMDVLNEGSDKNLRAVQKYVDRHNAFMNKQETEFLTKEYGAGNFKKPTVKMAERVRKVNGDDNVITYVYDALVTTALVFRDGKVFVYGEVDSKNFNEQEERKRQKPHVQTLKSHFDSLDKMMTFS